MQPGYNIDPAIEKYALRDYSIEPDLVNGWKSRIKHPKELPLECSFQVTNAILHSQAQTKHKDIVYLGPRFASNIHVIQEYAWKGAQRNVEEASIYQEEQISRYPYKHATMKTSMQEPSPRPFRGMNPIGFPEDLHFDSNFECGNLDLVVKVGSQEYDLFMRVDTNSKGHFSWFMFRATPQRPKFRAKFSICNFYKQEILYTKGMKPYVLRRDGHQGWQQGGENVTYQRTETRYNNLSEKEMYSLSFEYDFGDEGEVWFAYSTPYSYSFLLHFLSSLQKQPHTKQFLQIDYTRHKTSTGLKTPVVTVGQGILASRKTVLITGRMHPGEAQGSWMLHSFLEYLCSEEARGLRESATFKIIPMVNIEGVILGNFRTNLRGSDVNREFNLDQKCKSAESTCVREVVESVTSPLIYLDFHGHSTKKGVFIYGPEYTICEQQYYLCRLFPKLMAADIEMFRYYSCSFRIAESKKFTARAAMFRGYHIPYCFTVEASTHSFVDAQNQEVRFTREFYSQMGKVVAGSIEKVVKIYALMGLKEEGIRRFKQARLSKQTEPSLTRLQLTEISRQRQKPGKKTRSLPKMPSHLLSGLKELCSQFPQLLPFVREIKAQKLSTEIDPSDSSDCESEDQSYSRDQLKNILANIRPVLSSSNPRLLSIRKCFKAEKKSPKRPLNLKTEIKSEDSFFEAEFVGKIHRLEESMIDLKRVDLKDIELPPIIKECFEFCPNPSKKSQKPIFRNKTLEREQRRSGPVSQLSPLSHRNHTNTVICNDSQVYREVPADNRICFPWLSKKNQSVPKPFSPQKYPFNSGIHHLSSQLIESSVRKDYKRRKANKSYHIANIVIDQYH